MLEGLTERERLKLFVHRVRMLSERRLVREGLQSRFNLKFDNAPRQLRYKLTQPDEEDLRSFLLDFRFFVAQKDPVYIYKVFKACQDYLDSSFYREQLEKAKAEWKRALSLIKARPVGGQEGSKAGRKGSDSGIDGVITFVDDSTGKPKRAIVQVKSGGVKVGDIRDLIGTLQREQAAMGIFLTLEPASRPMLIEAAAAGVYRSPGWQRDYPKVQILTVADLLNGAEVKMPPASTTFKQAQRAGETGAVQRKLEL